MKVKRKYEVLKKQKEPFRFILGYFLWKSGLCKFFLIKFPLFKLRFHKTGLSRQLWIDKYDRSADFDFFQKYLRNGDNVVDIGANIGSLTLHAATLVGEEGKVYSFEPHPLIYQCLKSNISLNNTNNIKTYNLALGNEKGKLRFSDFKGDDQNKLDDEGQIEVDVTTLDSIVKETIINLLKVDVEGFEFFVFKGAKNILMNTRCIYFECYENGLKNYGTSTKMVTDILKNSGFKIYKYLDKRLEIIEGDFIAHTNINLIAVKDVADLENKLQLSF